MQLPFSRAPAGVEPSKPRPAAGPPTLTGRRWRKLLSYYRPHLGLLFADLGCALIVAVTALALPLCANFILKRLSLPGGAGPHLLGQVTAIGVLMLALLALQALGTLFPDYQGHVMGAKMEIAL